MNQERQEQSVGSETTSCSNLGRRCHRDCSWKPTSEKALVEAEEKILANVKTCYEKKFANLPNGERLWTVMFNKDIEKTPLVIVHGFAAGIGLWSLNYDTLAAGRPLYAFDVLGFARSSHPKFEKEASDSENQFVESIESWREAMGIEKMVLLGHSFGGFLVSSYALKYPDRIEHLLLIDPWGYQEWQEEFERIRVPLWAKGLIRILSPFNPLSVIRAAGPLGPRLIRLRGDLANKFTDVSDDGSPIFDYIYHCNAQKPSGEVGFKNLTVKVGFAKNPMIRRIGNLKAGLPVTFIYGGESWNNSECARRVTMLLPDNDVKIHVVKDAGHHVYADQPDIFHEYVNSICNRYD